MTKARAAHIARFQTLQQIEMRCFPLPVFEKKSNHKSVRKILKDIPDFEKFNQNVKNIQNQSKKDISVEIMPCYQLPVLSREQSHYAFVKMNYYKYKFMKLREQIDINAEKFPFNHIITLEYYLRKYQSIRNFIATCNYRLAISVIRYAQKNNLVNNDECISDCYQDILRAVDYFDYRKGNAFSTYASMVMQNNIRRNFCERMNEQNRYVAFDEQMMDNVSCDNSFEDECTHNENTEIINKCIEILQEKIVPEERAERYVSALKHYYGIGTEPKTLEKIGKMMNVSKERIRQMNDFSIECIKKHVSNDILWACAS